MTLRDVFIKNVATVLMDETATIQIPNKMPLRVFGASWKTCKSDAFGSGSYANRILDTESRNASNAHSNGSMILSNDNAPNSPVDLFLTHSPPRVERAQDDCWRNRAYRMKDIVDKFRIPLHLSGHVHYARGAELHDNRKTVCINCATAQANRPVVIDYDVNQHHVVRVEI